MDHPFEEGVNLLISKIAIANPNVMAKTQPSKRGLKGARKMSRTADVS